MLYINFTGGKNAKFPYPNDCKKFVSCSNNIPIEMSCPGGLKWDDTNKMCNWPDLVKCSKGILNNI